MPQQRARVCSAGSCVNALVPVSCLGLSSLSARPCLRAPLLLMAVVRCCCVYGFPARTF